MVRGCLTIGVQFKECSKVQYAIQIIEKVLGEGIKSVKEGMTELDLTAEFEYLIRKFGAEGPSFSTTVLSGDKSSLPHGSPDRKIINKGDFLLIDMGVIIDGYCSDITRTFVVVISRAWVGFVLKRMYISVKKEMWRC